MHHFVTRTSSWPLLLTAVVFTMVGYFLAVVSFRQDEWIDYRSGAYKTTCSLFPFSLSSSPAPNAFQGVFDVSLGEQPEWHVVESRYFVHPDTFLLREVESITEPQLLVGAQARLVAFARRQNLDVRSREALAREYLRVLRTRGANAALSYVDSLIVKEMADEVHRLEEKGSQDPLWIPTAQAPERTP